MNERLEPVLRLSCFLGVLLGMALWEMAAPRRVLSVRKAPRWTANLGLVVLNTVLTRLVIPVTAAGTALTAGSRQWGLLHQVDWPDGLELLLAVTALDFAIYLQHVLFHAVPVLWRLHRVHHADLDLDVTTGLRFHTFEILLSALIKLGAVLVIGPSVLAVIVFEVLLNAAAMFNHSNVRLPERLDRALRWCIVTPDMHRVHHSIIHREMNSNYGFNIPWWDYLLGTYRAQPAHGHSQMTLGVAELREESQVDRLPGMLLLPFQSDAASSDSDRGATDGFNHSSEDKPGNSHR